MSSAYKYPSVEEIKEKRQKRRSKGKQIMSSEPEPQTKSVPEETRQMSTETFPEKSVSRKRKHIVDQEEDLDNVILKIPRSTTIISDPFGLDPFVEGLLLEEDENRLKELGPIETARRMQAQTFQTLESSIFLRKYAENCQRRMRELEKSNTSLRKELSESRVEAGECKEKLKETQATLKETQLSLKQAESILVLEHETNKVELDSYKEALSRVEEEKNALAEEMDDIAYGAMMRERGRLMEQYLAGEHENWTPEKWAKYCQKLNAGENPSSSEGEEEEEEGEKSFLEEKVETGVATEEPLIAYQGAATVEEVGVPELVEVEAVAKD